MRYELRGFRLAAGKSQAEMARRYGVGQQTWSFWETGRSTPRPRMMLRIAQDMGKGITEVFPDVFASGNTK